MRKKGSHYSNDEKYHFIRLYHESGMSKRSFCKLHGISSASQWRNRQTLWGGCTDANPKLLLNDT